jgi:hypothetical protein
VHPPLIFQFQQHIPYTTHGSPLKPRADLSQARAQDLSESSNTTINKEIEMRTARQGPVKAEKKRVGEFEDKQKREGRNDLGAAFHQGIGKISASGLPRWFKSQTAPGGSIRYQNR